MPQPSPANKGWPKYALRADLPYIRAADTANDKLTAACASDPHLVFLGASPKDTGLPGFGGEIRIDYRSPLEEGAAARAMADVAGRVIGELDGYTNILTDIGSEVVTPTIQQAGEKAQAAVSLGVSGYVLVGLALFALAVWPRSARA